MIVDDFALFLFSPIIPSCLTKGRREPDLTPPKNFDTPPSTLLLPRFFCFYRGVVYRFPRLDAPRSGRVYPHAREPSRGIIKCAGCVVRPFVSLLFLYAHSFRARRMCRSVCCDGGAVRRINTLSVPSGDHVTHPPTHLQFLLFFSPGFDNPAARRVSQPRRNARSNTSRRSVRSRAVSRCCVNTNSTLWRNAKAMVMLSVMRMRRRLPSSESGSAVEATCLWDQSDVDFSPRDHVLPPPHAQGEESGDEREGS